MEKQAFRKDRTCSKTTFVNSVVFSLSILFRMRQREETRAKFATRWKEGEKKKAAEVIIMMMNDSGDDINDESMKIEDSGDQNHHYT